MVEKKFDDIHKLQTGVAHHYLTPGDEPGPK